MLEILKNTLIKIVFSIILFTIFNSFISCSSIKSVYSNKERLKNAIISSDVLSNQFTGFVLYDLKKNKTIVDINGEKYFTPASNTKLFTFYTSLMVLGDSLPILEFVTMGDSLIFRGTGNPLCLNPFLRDNKSAINFLKERNEKLYFCDDNFIDHRFGSGWAWDDYKYYYQAEKSSFPIYGNLLTNYYKEDSFIISPLFFKENVKLINDSNYYWRSEFKNEFLIGINDTNRIIRIPFIIDSTTVLSLLNTVVDKKIESCPNTEVDFDKKHLEKIPFPNSIYIRLLHQSDNFIAEQLMLMCSFVLFDTINTKKAINWSKENILVELNEKSRWVDGSGLSRYNLFSPSDFVYVLKKIYNKLEWNKLIKLLPTAGQSGTLKNYYNEIDTSYIYAKSGSLSNNYNLSGYIITKKGNKYIFSFMNNHFLKSNKLIKAEMESFFKMIYQKF